MHAAGAVLDEVDDRPAMAAQEAFAGPRLDRTVRHPCVHRRQPFADVVGAKREEVGRLPAGRRDDAEALAGGDAHREATGGGHGVALHGLAPVVAAS